MATRVLLHLSDATNRCFFSNVQCYRMKFHVQNVVKHNRHFRRVRETKNNPSEGPFGSSIAEYSGTANGKTILKTFLFTTTFTGGTLVAATILEYERIRAATINKISTLDRFTYSVPFRSSKDDLRSKANRWWNGLTEGQRVFYFIAFANTLVFLAWRIKQWEPVMLRYFASNPASSTTYSPMLLSVFSHYNSWHLVANMYVLHSFISTAVEYLGREHFIAVYLSSGVFASFFSNTYKILLNNYGFSLGASGAIMGVLGFVCSQFPDTKLSFIFLSDFTFSAGSAITALMTFDFVGCLMKWRFFDHAAHLGGILFGMCWQKWGIENVWRKRSPLMAWWHELRSPKK